MFNLFDPKMLTTEELCEIRDYANSEIVRRNSLINESQVTISNIWVEEFNPGPHMANTLDPEVIGKNQSGWTITGDIHKDYYKWVNEFSATHENGKWWVKGDFESKVEASSKEAYDDFVKYHPPHEWDYWDI
jgi:hypothetical protein